MAKQTINVGTSANSGGGDPLRNALIKVNENFDEVYTKLAALEDGNVITDVVGSVFSDDSTLLVDGVNSSINLNGTVKGNIIPDVDEAYDLGSPTKKFRDLYLSGTTIYLGDTPLSIDNGTLLIDGVAVSGTGGTGDVRGSVFADDSTLLVDGVNASIPYSVLSGAPTIPTNLNDIANVNTITPVNGDFLMYANGEWVNAVILNNIVAGSNISLLNNDAGYVRAADIADGTLTIDVNNTGDLQGSVFGDDSTLLVDAVNSTIPYSVLSGAPTIPADIGDLTDTGNLLGAGSADSLTNNDDINITVNNDDSSSYTWNFGNTGTLTAPGDIKTGLLNTGGRFVQDCADGTTSMRWINVEEGSTNTQILRVYTGETGPERIERAQLLLNWSGDNDEYSGFTIKSFDNTDPENETEHNWVFQGDGSLIAPGTITAAAIQTDSITIGVGGTVNGQGATLGNFASVGTDEINSENDISIRVNLTDSTTRVWRFGEDGNLEAPGIVSAAGLRTSETKIALGTLAGATNQGADTVAVGNLAGETNQGANGIAIGALCGVTNQGSGSIAIGGASGNTSQGAGAVAIGYVAGGLTQGQRGIAIGDQAGSNNQGAYAIAIGSLSGGSNQGANSIAIGRNAGATGTFADSIILNATGSALSSSAAGFFVNPVRNIDGGTFLTYNATTKEIGWSSDILRETGFNIDINLSDSTLRRWQFGEDGVLNVPGAIQLSNGAQIFNTASVDNSITIGATGTNGTSTFNGTGFFNDDVYFHKAIQEKFTTLQDATGTVTHDCANGSIFYHTSPDANWTVNLTNFTGSLNYATTVTLIISQGGTGYYPNALEIDSSAQTINWQGNTNPTPSSNRVDVVSFSIYRTGAGYTVLGQLTGF